MLWQNEADARRESARILLLFDPLLLDKEGRVMARVADLSLHGALLFARRGMFTVGETIVGWLQSPPLDGEDEIFLAIGLTIRWISEDRLAGWSRMGCSMEPMDDQSFATLKHLIELTAP